MFPDPRPGTRLLTLVAHPDDETFGCGSALLLAAAAGVETVVACASRGEAGEVAPGVELEGDLGSAREGELHEAARRLGVTRVVLWPFADSGMAGPAPAGSLAAADPDEVAEAVRRTVADAAPDALLTLDASDGHRDHVSVRDASVRTGRELGLPTYLSCLPRSLMRRWAAHMAAAHRNTAYLQAGELGTPDDELTHTLDARVHLGAREHAIAAHRSQSTPFDGLPDDLRRAFLADVHLRLVQT